MEVKVKCSIIQRKRPSAEDSFNKMAKKLKSTQTCTSKDVSECSAVDKCKIDLQSVYKQVGASIQKWLRSQSSELQKLTEGTDYQKRAKECVMSM